MLNASHPLARRFQQHALEARQRALESRSLLLRNEYFASERWWLKLAESYDFSTRVGRLIDNPRAADVDAAGSAVRRRKWGSFGYWHSIYVRERQKEPPTIAKPIRDPD